MKRILLMVMCFVVLSMGVCSAEIFRTEDSFTSGKRIGSHFYCGKDMQYYLDQTSFYKTVFKDNIIFTLGIYVRTFHDYSISEKDGEINIDSDIVSNFKIFKRDIHYSGGAYISDVDYYLPIEVINKLNTAKRVALRFTQNNGNQFIYVLPDEILAEWKEVINTTE